MNVQVQPPRMRHEAMRIAGKKVDTPERIEVRDVAPTALVLGSASGTSPGIDLGAFTLPLVLDLYTRSTLLLANSALLPGSFGPLDAIGHRAAAVDLPSGVSPALAGLELHHACVLFSGGSVVGVSNAAPLELAP